MFKLPASSLTREHACVLHAYWMDVDERQHNGKRDEHSQQTLYRLNHHAPLWNKTAHAWASPGATLWANAVALLLRACRRHTAAFTPPKILREIYQCAHSVGEPETPNPLEVKSQTPFYLQIWSESFEKAGAKVNETKPKGIIVDLTSNIQATGARGSTKLHVGYGLGLILSVLLLHPYHPQVSPWFPLPSLRIAFHDRIVHGRRKCPPAPPLPPRRQWSDRIQRAAWSSLSKNGKDKQMAGGGWWKVSAKMHLQLYKESVSSMCQNACVSCARAPSKDAWIRWHAGCIKGARAGTWAIVDCFRAGWTAHKVARNLSENAQTKCEFSTSQTFPRCATNPKLHGARNIHKPRAPTHTERLTHAIMRRKDTAFKNGQGLLVHECNAPVWQGQRTSASSK